MDLLKFIDVNKSFYDTMKMLCIKESQRLFALAKEQLKDIEDRGSVIYETVVKCFLLKKCLYVQFMMNKTLLDLRFDGDIRLQRKAAKAYADEIPFISYSELWRSGQNEPTVEQKDSNVIQEIMSE